MTTFGDKIRKLRKEKKMTQQKLGEMCIRDSFCEYEGGINNAGRCQFYIFGPN